MELHKKIGEGKFGTVYKAKLKGEDEFVAVKVISLKQTKINPMLERVIKVEKETLMTLRHPNVIRLLQLIRTQKDVNFVYDLCDGGNLREYSASNELTENDILRILIEISNVLREMKTKQIVHRDIKPENILINKGSAVLADFGLSMTGPPTAHDKSSIGSPLFMAPESMLRFDYSNLSDIYSLGLSIVEVIMGELPFGGHSRKDIYKQKLQFNFLQYREDEPNCLFINDPLANIIDRMTKGIKDERISIEELSAEISRLQRQNDEVSGFRDSRYMALSEGVKCSNVNTANLLPSSCIEASFRTASNISQNECLIQASIYEYIIESLDQMNMLNQFTPTIVLAFKKFAFLIDYLQQTVSENESPKVRLETSRLLAKFKEFQALCDQHFKNMPKLRQLPYNKQFQGVDALEISVASAAVSIKYDADTILSNLDRSLEAVRQYLLISWILASAVEIKSLVDLFNILTPIQSQQFYTRLEKQDLDELHIRLAELIDSIEPLAYYEIGDIQGNPISPTKKPVEIKTIERRSSKYAAPAKKIVIGTRIPRPIQKTTDDPSENNISFANNFNLLLSEENAASNMFKSVETSIPEITNSNIVLENFPTFQSKSAQPFKTGN